MTDSMNELERLIAHNNAAADATAAAAARERALVDAIEQYLFNPREGNRLWLETCLGESVIALRGTTAPDEGQDKEGT